MNSLDFLKNSVIRVWRSGERLDKSDRLPRHPHNMPAIRLRAQNIAPDSTPINGQVWRACGVYDCGAETVHSLVT